MMEIQGSFMMYKKNRQKQKNLKMAKKKKNSQDSFLTLYHPNPQVESFYKDRGWAMLPQTNVSLSGSFPPVEKNL